MRARTLRWAALGAGVALLGAGAWIVGPGAPGFISWIAEGRSAWRLGKIHLEGVRGPHLGALTAQRLTLRDEDGIWAEARNIEIAWAPLAILFGDIDIAQISAAEIDVARRPILSAPRPPGVFQPNVDIARMDVAAIHLAEAVAGREAFLRFNGAMEMDDRDLAALLLEFERSDAATDRLSFRLNPSPGELLRVELVGAAGGIAATALGVEERAVTLAIDADGDAEEGAARIAGAVGADEFAAGQAAWNAQRWSADLAFHPRFAPIFADITRRLGPIVRLSAGGARAERGAAPFVLEGEAENLTLRAEGELTDEWRINGPTRTVLATPDINRLTPEFTLSSRAASVAGDLTFPESRLRLRGTGRLTEMEIAGGRVDAEGDLSLDWSARSIDVTLDMPLTARGPPEVRNLLANGRLAAQLVYDRIEERFAIRRGTLSSDALRADAAGAVTDAAGEISGRWRVQRLAAANPILTGAMGGAWRMTRANDQPWRIETSGRAERFTSSNEALAQALGGAPELDFIGHVIDGGVQVERAALTGPKLRIGAQGRFTETLNMRWEAAARGPIQIGEAQLAGTMDATGAITGPLARPAYSGEARLQRFDLAGLVLDDPVVTFAYDAGAHSGEVSVVGAISGQPASAQANVRTTSEGVQFTDLTANALGVEAVGAAGFGAAGPSADLEFSGALTGESISGRIEGALRLTPERRAAPRLDLDARLQQALIGDLRLSEAAVSLDGRLDNLTAALRMRGVSGATPIEFNADGTIVTSGGQTIAALEASGRMNGDILATRGPARIVIADGVLDAQASVVAGSGSAELSWRAQGSRFAAAAIFDRAELSPFAALAGRRMEGTISGEARLASEGAGLAGAANVTIDGARLPARMRSPLDVRIDAQLTPTRVAGSVEARSADGLDAAIEGEAPVETRANPLRIALTEGGEGRASWRATGPADSLWSLIGGLDQSLTGRIEGQGRIRFGAAALTGGGRLALTDGRFEDKRAGLDFHDLTAELVFRGNGASRFTLTASDGEGGRLSGEGTAQHVRTGQMALTLSGLRFIDREDIRARASGELALNWTSDGAALTGDLTLDTAELTLAAAADAAIPELAVIEINRPGGDLPPPRPRPAGPTATLDMHLSAPGRFYTRGRGLNAEWSIDTDIRGTTNAPTLFGEARLIRGEFDLAGRPFDLERGRILLSGPVDAATIDLLASRTEADLTANVAIAGDLMDPTITLSSTPALPEDEILPRILFGRAADDLSAVEGAQLAASLAALAGGAAFDIAGMARAAIGLDRFDVREDEAGILITGGRYLTRDVYLEVSRSGLGEAGTRLEWRVRPQLSLVTSFLADGDQRASVRWRRDY